MALPLLSLVGISNSFFMTMNNTLVLERAPEHLRGRIMSVMIVVWGLAPVGAALAGLLAGATDVRVSLSTGGALALAVGLLVFSRRRALREA